MRANLNQQSLKYWRRFFTLVKKEGTYLALKWKAAQVQFSDDFLLYTVFLYCFAVYKYLTLHDKHFAW